MGHFLQKGERIGPMLKCICGAEFYKPPSSIRNGRGKFCSKVCQYANYPKQERTGSMAVCVCGTEFYVEPNLKKIGKGKFCSLHCKRANMMRRSGLHYNLKIVNRAWIKPGQRFAPQYEFKKGVTSHNFKAEGVGYDALHDWVRRHKGKPQKCEHCSSVRNLNWANISWEYKRELDDWMQLCSKCHHAYDRNGGWGIATAKFPELQRRKLA